MRKLKILFLTKKNDLNIGSYRIWIKNLSQKLNIIGHHSSIKNKVPKKLLYDVIFFGKDYKFKEISEIKNKFSKNLFLTASINPPIESKYEVDFVITGSIEESCSLTNYKEQFLYPLIESDKFYKKKIFIKNKKRINILIHGNHTHLKALFNYGFENAIKNYYRYLDDKNLDYNLIFFLDKLPNFYKMKLEKQKLNYDFIKYDYNKVSTIFNSADIAIVTSSTIDIKNESISISNFFKKEKIFFEDINLKFKNKSNFGRALLAMQNGLSVITDITPSNLSLYNYQKQNILFFINHHQLLDNLIKLTNYNFRKKISNNAYNSVKHFNFNSNEFVIKLIKYINNLILKNEINYKKNL